MLVDYYSKFPDLAKLEYKTAEFIIIHLKSMFARHGIPKELVSDTCHSWVNDLVDFALEWGVELTTSSPCYAQSNGQA